MHRSRIIQSFLILALLATTGCKEKTGNDEDTATDVAQEDVQEETDVVADSAEDPTVEDVREEDTATPPTACEILGLPEVEMQEGPLGPGLKDIAPDFSVATLDGMWTLSEHWTGCDVILVIQDVPAQESSWGISIWERDVSTLFARLPRNVQLLFVSTDPAWTSRQEALVNLQTSVNAHLDTLDAEQREWWLDRVAYITEQDSQMGGWLQTQMRTWGWGVGIDRFQRIRFIGSYADPTRFNASAGWFQPNISMAANEAIYYNFEAEREERLESQSATVVRLFNAQIASDPEWAGVRVYNVATLPDSTTMATFDTMEFDLTMDCVGDGERGYCPAWDYDVFMYLCDDAEPDTCTHEVGHWITTYHREGRWVHDVSSLLPLFASGGEHHFAFYTQQQYEITAEIRLFDSGKTERPEEITFLWAGDAFDTDYNDSFAPIDVHIPADAVRVELATVISGHGGSDPGNCAEFCNTTHHFWVNSTENIRSFPEAGAGTDCQDKVAIGTVPNQYGTWWYGRSGWCPGLEVPLVTIDITDQVTLDADNTFDYEGFYLGSPYPSGGARIRMKSWVVVHR